MISKTDMHTFIKCIWTYFSFDLDKTCLMHVYDSWGCEQVIHTKIMNWTRLTPALSYGCRSDEPRTTDALCISSRYTWFKTRVNLLSAAITHLAHLCHPNLYLFYKMEKWFQLFLLNYVTVSDVRDIKCSCVYLKTK